MVEEANGNLPSAACPFMSGGIVPVANKLNPHDVQPITNLQQCVGAICIAWNDKTKRCKVVEGMEALVEMKNSLGKLGKLSGLLG